VQDYYYDEQKIFENLELMCVIFFTVSPSTSHHK